MILYSGKYKPGTIWGNWKIIEKGRTCDHRHCECLLCHKIFKDISCTTFSKNRHRPYSGCKECIDREKFNKRYSEFKKGFMIHSWIIIKRAKYKYGKGPRFHCECKCGRDKKILEGAHLLLGTTKQCRECAYDLKRNKRNWNSWRGVGEVPGNLMSSLNHRKRKFNLELNVTLEYLWNLFLKQNRRCALSGIKIFFEKTCRDRGTASLDRIDSNKGYVEGNVQWVHKNVNWMKQDLSDREFIAWCGVIAKYNKGSYNG